METANIQVGVVACKWCDADDWTAVLPPLMEIPGKSHLWPMCAECNEPAWLMDLQD